MKSLIRFGILCIALICFSNQSIAQKKSKKKAKTTVSSKKKKKPSKKSSSKKRPMIKKRSTTAKYAAPINQAQLIVLNEMPVKTIQLDSVPEKVINIISAFKPQLKNIAKIGFQNATALVDTNTVILAYQVPSQNLSFQYQPIALVPRAIKKDSLMVDRQTANIKIGMGNYFNQLLQIQAGLTDRKEQQHHIIISNESIEGMHPVQKWNSTILNYNNALSISKKQNLHTQIYFNQSNRYRYGLVPDTTKLPIHLFDQKLTVAGVNLALVQKQPSNRTFYVAPILNFNHSNLVNQANLISIDLNSPFYYTLNDQIKLHTDLLISYTQYQINNGQKSQNSIVQLDPSIEIKKSKFKLNLGVRPTLSNGDFALYPKIEWTNKLRDTNFVFTAGWKTSIMNNQLVALMNQNHWIAAPTTLPISSIESKYIQVSVTANKRLNYSFNMALNDYRELPFFNQSKSSIHPKEEGLKFDVLFEKRAIAIELTGDLSYQLSDQLLWKNHFKYIQFNLIRENEQAWGILPFELNSQLNWFMNKKMQFDASGQFWTGAKTNAGSGNAYQLNNTFVLNAGIQYAINDNWTFWGKGENLLDQQYQRWANYPSLGVQFIAGIQYKFSKK